MGIDLRENGSGFEDILRHRGHRVEAISFGREHTDENCFDPETCDMPDGGYEPFNAAIVCETCQEVLIDFDRPADIEDAKDHVGCDLHAVSSGIVSYDAEARDDGTVVVDYTSGEEGWHNVMSFDCDTHGVRVRAENVEGV